MMGWLYSNLSISWTLVGSNEEINLKKTLWYSGNIYQLRMPYRSPISLYLSDFLLWTLRTSVHLMGRVLLDHVDLRGALSQPLNIYDEQKRCEIMACACIHATWERDGLGHGG
jgi:hypothetical protein